MVELQNNSSGDVALRRALKLGMAGVGVLLVVLLPIVTFKGGVSAFYAGVIGILMGGFFLLTTDLLIIFGSKLPANRMLIAMLGTTVLKILLVFLILFVLHRYNFYDKKILGLTILLTWLFVFFIEIYVIFTSKQPYIDVKQQEG